MSECNNLEIKECDSLMRSLRRALLLGDPNKPEYCSAYSYMYGRTSDARRSKKLFAGLLVGEVCC